MDWKKKLKFIFIVCAFLTLILIVLSNVFKMTQVSEKDFKTYRQGVYFLEKKDLENAYYNFINISKTSAIYEIALLRQALCADELNDSQTATKKYKMFIEKYPDSIFIEKTYYALAQNYYKEKDFNKAEKTFNEIKKLYKDSDYKIASDYYLGEIFLEKANIENNKKNKQDYKEKSKDYFIKYLEIASGGKYSLISAEKIKLLNIPLTPIEHFYIGEAYYKNGLYTKALNNFNKANISDSWGYLSLVNTKLNKYKVARTIFEENFPKYSNNIDDELIQKIIDNYVAISSDNKKQTLYKILELSKTTTVKGEDYVLYCLCKYVDENTKNNFYRKIFTNYPQGKFASYAIANLFWSAYQKKDYKEAKFLGQIHLRDYQNTISAPQVLFWMAKLSEKQGYRTEARSFYQRLLEKYPDDYYAYRADKYLSHTQNNSWKTKITHKLPEKKENITFPTKHANISDDNIALINNILSLNDDKLLAEIDKNNKVVQSWINYKEGNYSTASLFARDAIAEMQIKPDFSDSIYKLAYQLHYQEPINHYAKIYKLDPYLVIALIREESYFNTQAGSAVGARGLMQLMPATAAYIANNNNISYRNSASLLTPDTNIELGCAYLHYVKSRLNNDDLLSVAAYNGGPNAVLKWKQSLNYKNFDEFIENIPYQETKDYIKKVFRSYWVYLNLY